MCITQSTKQKITSIFGRNMGHTRFVNNVKERRKRVRKKIMKELETDISGCYYSNILHHQIMSIQTQPSSHSFSIFLFFQFIDLKSYLMDHHHKSCCFIADTESLSLSLFLVKSSFIESHKQIIHTHTGFWKKTWFHHLTQIHQILLFRDLLRFIFFLFFFSLLSIFSVQFIIIIIIWCLIHLCHHRHHHHHFRCFFFFKYYKILSLFMNFSNFYCRIIQTKRNNIHT